MFWVDAKRILRSGFQNFKRGGVVSFASILVMTITLSVVGITIYLQALLGNLLNQITEKVDVTVYFISSASEDEIFEVQKDLEALLEVKEVNYTSKDEALANFRIEFKDDFTAIQAIDELDENPLLASLSVLAKDPSQYESIVRYLESDAVLGIGGENIIDNINYSRNKVMIDRLSSIIENSRTMGIAVTILLMAISVIITFNTIRLTIYISREEIGVMRLVGAENRYIRGPFIVEGVIYGLIAAILTMIIFYPLSLWLGNKMTILLGMNFWEYYKDHFLGLILLLILAGSVLGTISSLLAIRKYLKK
ncbi:ABC transporter permease [Candidatus Nomurabacteria bacterium]|nr:ABC transporter permease [Candidatus Nomurabacteria bacterium]USN94481.1 MAG: ABC transporter permease [Candidatus Nomurabacteria bacterium]